MVRTVRVAEPSLFSTMNVTPFIDVMLVLLIVMILSLPIQSHKIPIELPNGGSAATPATSHVLAIDRSGALFWDGRALDDAQLAPALAAMQRDPAAVLHVNTHPDARYDRFDAVLAMVKRAGVTRLGFVGNEQMRSAF